MSSSTTAAGLVAFVPSSPLPSRGSKNHVNGRCRPCRDALSASGCPSGDKCNFCHFEHDEEKFRQIALLDQMRREKMACKPSQNRDDISETTSPRAAANDVAAVFSHLAERRGLAGLSCKSRTNFCSPQFGGECCGSSSPKSAATSYSPTTFATSYSPTSARSTMTPYSPAFSDSLPSRGSKNHMNGRCRPCRDFLSPEGCRSGDKCNFCHLVHDEAKFKQIAMLDQMRAERRANKLGNNVEPTTPSLTETQSESVAGPPGLELLAEERPLPSLLARRRGMVPLAPVGKENTNTTRESQSQQLSARQICRGDRTTPTTVTPSFVSEVASPSPRSPLTPWNEPMYVQLC